MHPKHIKVTRLDHIMHTEMGFSVGSFFAMGDTELVEKGTEVTVLDSRRDGEREFVAYRTPEGRNLYTWINTSYLGG